MQVFEQGARMELSIMYADGRENSFKALKSLGFKALLGWHYLILFSPVFISSSGSTSSSFLLYRQLVLYGSLAATFVVLTFFGRLLFKKSKGRPSLVLLSCIGFFAMATVALSAFTSSSALYMQLISVALLGASEALLMFLWVYYYVNSTTGHLVKSFAVDMFCGGLVGMFVCALLAPFNYMVAAILPAIATVSLMMNWSDSSNADSVDNEGQRANDEEDMKSETTFSFNSSVFLFTKTLAPTFIYAFVVGILQGMYFYLGVAVLVNVNPFVFLGILIAALCIFYLSSRIGNSANSSSVVIDAVHRFSLLFFVVGAILLLFATSSALNLTLSEIAILAGFNLFDFAGMVVGIVLIQELKPKSFMVLNGGRALTYVSLALGLIVGNVMVSLFGEAHNTVGISTVVALSVVLLVATVLVPFHDFNKIALQSKSEIEVSSNAKAVNKASTGVFHSALSISEKSLVIESQEAKKEVREAEELKKDKHSESPWRQACSRVAQRYRLSPRETEIFFLIAKGRNAEFVQKELVISMHTAKTHIANIYKKLGIHSFQEMLDLIELCRKDDDLFNSRSSEEKSRT